MSDPTAPPHTAPATDIHPSDILTHLIVTLLAPMFLLASGGDIIFARMAALETLNAYQARDHVDLIAISQIIGCGLAALGSLCLSMTDDISLSMTLRLRGNAVALNRTAEQNRRVLQTNRPALPASAADIEYEAAVLARVADTQKRVAATQNPVAATQTPVAETQNPVAATQTPVAETQIPVAETQIPVAATQIPVAAAPKAAADAPPQNAATKPTDQQMQALWAAAMSDVAAEQAASLIHLPPEQRKLASRRAAALSSCANQLLTGDAPPRPRPGDLTIPSA